MSDLVTIRGIVGTEPQLSITPKGVSILKFRVATHERKRDLETGQWAEGPTNWYAVSAFRALGENSMESLAQGDHVMIFGKLQIREFERADGSRGISADIEAYSIGHDLRFGTSSFNRVRTDTGELERVQHPSRSADTEGSWQSDDGEAA
ncbi:single-stranded DNA-binding protein [Glutamicibacter sp.]|uniref:single-stranded DNA-binding protein n=1 Tax=Glutamicibacter sp. TaxID=1931995 RepID=UPI003D6B2F26